MVRKPRYQVRYEIVKKDSTATDERLFTQDELKFMLNVVAPEAVEDWLFALKWLARKQSITFDVQRPSVQTLLHITRS